MTGISVAAAVAGIVSFLSPRPAARARLSLARFRRYYYAVEVASGALLLIIDVVVFTGRMTWLSSQLGFLNRFVL